MPRQHQPSRRGALLQWGRDLLIAADYGRALENAQCLAFSGAPRAALDWPGTWIQESAATYLSLAGSFGAISFSQLVMTVRRLLLFGERSVREVRMRLPSGWRKRERRQSWTGSRLPL
jgi:hypothetical protein